MTEDFKVNNHYMLSDEKLNKIKNSFIKIQNLTSFRMQY